MNTFRNLAMPIAVVCGSTMPANAGDLLTIAEFEGRWQSEQSSASIGFMTPFQLSSSDLIFFEISGTAVERGLKQGSVGTGYRFDAGNDVILGVYGYYDYLQSERKNDFHQFSFGAEALAPRFETRANVYLPVGHGAAIVDAGRGFVSDGQFWFREGRERARPGVDAEVGVKMPDLFGDGNAQLKVFGGSYWYGGRNIDDMFGGKLRAELSFANLPGLPESATVSLGTGVTYDNEDRWGGSVVARLRIPLGGRAAIAKTEPFDPWTQGVIRDRTIRTHAGATGDIEKAVLESNGREIDGVVNLSAETGDISVVNELLENAGSNALALLDGDLSLGDSLQLQDGQTLLGGGGTLALYGASSNAGGTYTNNGSMSTLTGNNSAADVITMSDNSTVSSLAVRGGHAGIGSYDSSNITVDNVDISASGHDGIRLSNVDGALISNSTIHDLTICEDNTACEFAVYDPNTVPYAAISAHGTSGLTVRDVSIENVTYGAFVGSVIDDSDWPTFIADLASDIRFENVTIKKSRREGVLLVGAQDVVMDKVTIDNEEQDRDMDLVVIQGTSNVSITDMTLKGGINGLMLVSAMSLPDEAVTTNVRVDGLTVENTKNAGVFFNPVADIALKNVSISNAGTYGMFIYGDEWGYLGGPVSDIALDNVMIDSAKTAGLYFMGPAENLSGDVTVTNTPADCKSTLSWTGRLSGSLTQADGSVLTVNGTPLDSENFEDRCS